MQATFRLSIVSPDRTVVDEPATSLIVPGREGYLGVLAGHMPLVTELKVGRITYARADGVQVNVAISGGFMEIDGTRAIVLADTAEKSTEIDPDRARVALTAAKDALGALTAPGPEQDEHKAAMERAENRLRIFGEM
jgi:F-type H+-transporting ATPase subunit epsilon